ncbi:serine hydrolase [Persicobacter diffluens]|uniref:Serine hydrolase n=1 Tax=Persicobacter diffluens TaxID=981 RepID=A0AAN4W4G8_9BACT|nr:serine hydrolase [Persicobacter diffluens]
MRTPFFLIFMVFGLPVFGQDSSESRLDKYLQKKVRKMGLIGMQASFVTDTYIWQGNYGIKDYKTKVPVNTNTLFMIASCSKPVTAMGILKLQDAGKLNLDDPINHHLPFHVANPNFPDEIITIRMLLTHTSSIRDNWEILTPLYTLPEGGDSSLPLLKFLPEYLLERGEWYDREKNYGKDQAGFSFQYCNVGYALLGLIIEEVTAKPFSEFIKEEIFIPLKMEQAYWFLADIPHRNIARPHEMPNKQTDFKAPKVLNHYGYPDYPDGQIRTTTSDYSRFLQVFLNEGVVNGERFLSKAAIDDFLKVQYPEKFKYQAIAWNYNEFENWIYYLLMPRLPSHTGADPGVATAVSFDPENKIGAIIFTNSPPQGFINQKRFYQEVMKKLLKAAKRQVKKDKQAKKHAIK